jgi:hypothetical protein
LDFLEKVRVRLNHWLSHKESHRAEYEKLAAELDEAGRTQSAREIREMVALSESSDECLRRALEALAD